MEWDDEIRFTLRGVDFHGFHLIDETPVGENYIRVTRESQCSYQGWYVFADDKRAVFALSGLPEPYDTALPQEWLDANRQEVADRGGWAVWHYPAGNLFGEPVFADTLETLARGVCAQEIASR